MEQSGTVDKAIDVLFHLRGAGEARGVTDIGRALALPKSSAHRLLASLRARGLVEQDSRGRYRLGIGLLALGLGVLDREPLVAAARPVMEREAAALSETVFLVSARAGSLYVLDKVEGTGFLRASPEVGSTVPVHATAVGKLYLAHAPGQVGAPGLEAFTERTLRSEGGLAAAVEQARCEGYAHNQGEWIDGLAVLAAPIMVGGQMAGALCTAFGQSRFDGHVADGLPDRVMGAAAQIGMRLQGESL